MTSYVYFMRVKGDGPIKIGTTRSHPRRRLGEVQVGCPWPIELIGAIEGAAAEEANFHKNLAEFKLSGEWFDPHPVVLSTINDAIQAGRSLPMDGGWEPKYDHPLCVWLARNRIRASSFAERVGITPGAITNIYRDGMWISRELAQKIYDATNGEVTPTDFLFWSPPKEQRAAA